MSWAEYRGASSTTKQKAPVMVTSTAGKIGYAPRVILTIRPWLMENPPAWLTAGANVQVLLGFAEHVGKLRIVRDGPQILRANSYGKKDTIGPRALSLTLRGIEGLALCNSACAKSSTGCENGGWVEVALPTKVFDASFKAIPKEEPVSLPPPKVSKPYSMIEGVFSREELSGRVQRPVR